MTGAQTFGSALKAFRRHVRHRRGVGSSTPTQHPEAADRARGEERRRHIRAIVRRRHHHERPRGRLPDRRSGAHWILGRADRRGPRSCRRASCCVRGREQQTVRGRYFGPTAPLRGERLSRSDDVDRGWRGSAPQVIDGKMLGSVGGPDPRQLEPSWRVAEPGRSDTNDCSLTSGTTSLSVSSMFCRCRRTAVRSSASQPWSILQ